MKMIRRTYLTMDDAYVNLAVDLEREKYGRDLSSMLINKFSRNWIVYVDGNFDPEEFPISDEVAIMKIDNWKRRFWFIYESTKARYEAILDSYTESADKLLAKIGSTTKLKFNDTPQNAGDFSGEEYTSTYTQSDTESDPTDAMNRLNDIYDKYRNVYKDWVGEFTVLFGEEIW